MAKNLTLGRGELWFAQYLAGTQTPGGERYIGNSPEFNATIETENLDHFDSDHGVNEKDESIPLSTNRTGSFITDNIDPKNVALFFFGESEIFSVAGATVTDEPINAVSPGLTYQLGQTSTNPSGARMLSGTTAPVVTDDAGTPVTFVAGTDYNIDLTLGRLTVLEGGGIGEGDNLQVTYTTLASSRERIISGSQAISGALRYIAFNPAGPQLDWYMPYVKISPNGDYALKGDEWQQIPFSIEILKKVGFEALYIDGRAYTP
jgi:hypothetical protein